MDMDRETATWALEIIRRQNVTRGGLAAMLSAVDTAGTKAITSADDVLAPIRALLIIMEAAEDSIRR